MASLEIAVEISRNLAEIGVLSFVSDGDQHVNLSKLFGSKPAKYPAKH